MGSTAAMAALTTTGSNACVNSLTGSISGCGSQNQNQSFTNGDANNKSGSSKVTTPWGTLTADWKFNYNPTTKALSFEKKINFQGINGVASFNKTFSWTSTKTTSPGFAKVATNYYAQNGKSYTNGGQKQNGSSFNGGQNQNGSSFNGGQNQNGSSFTNGGQQQQGGSSFTNGGQQQGGSSFTNGGQQQQGGSSFTNGGQQQQGGSSFTNGGQQQQGGSSFTNGGQQQGGGQNQVPFESSLAALVMLLGSVTLMRRRANS
jgi:hypothetical protein